MDPEISVLEIREEDFKIEWYSGTGAGGQHRNKHQNSCRITHIPTGITTTAQCRSRVTSLNEAKEALIEQLKQKNYMQKKTELAIDRKLQVGTGMRGDKIRTYRFQDDVVKDHVTGKSASVRQVLRGNFELMW